MIAIVNLFNISSSYALFTNRSAPNHALASFLEYAAITPECMRPSLGPCDARFEVAVAGEPTLAAKTRKFLARVVVIGRTRIITLTCCDTVADTIRFGLAA